MHWDFIDEGLKFNPNIIIAHNYRHLHTLKSLTLKKKLNNNCKVFLVTHAPFVQKNTTRSKIEDILVDLFDKTIGKIIINKYDKIITISKWELPFLKKIGVNKNKIKYIPNGVPMEFYKDIVNIKKNKKILYLGRIHPVKCIENLILAIKNTSINLEIIGFAEKKYLEKIKNLIKINNIKNVYIKKPIYNIIEKIQIYDSAEIYVLPSKRESSSQTLIEAMARKLIVISTATDGGKEHIKNNINGYLIPINNRYILEDKIKQIIKLNKKDKEKIKTNAYLYSKQFEIKKTINKLERLFYEN